MGMTCPTCNGPLAHLFTSSYCPKCEARGPVLGKAIGPIQGFQPDGTLFVGDDGELWIWKSGVSFRLTHSNSFGPVVAFQVYTAPSGDVSLLVMRSTEPTGEWVTQHLLTGMDSLLRDATPTSWSKPITVERV